MSSNKFYPNHKVQCRYHPHSHLIEDHRAGDMICSECGLIVGDRVIDVSSEWRTFSNDNHSGEDRSRVGGQEDPLLGPDLSTLIGPSVSGVSDYTSRQNMSNSEKALRLAFKTILEISERINVPSSITFRAKEVFKMVYEK